MDVQQYPRCCVAAAVALMTWGCGPGPSSEAASTVVYDSTGVAVVETAQGLWREDEGWELSATPILVIGPQGSDYEFHDIGGVTRLGDGRVVAADGGSSRILFFDPHGELITSAGGFGEGPGEFLWPKSIARLGGDSLAIHDWAPGRVTVLNSDGHLVTTMRLPERYASVYRLPGDRWLGAREEGYFGLPSRTPAVGGIHRGEHPLVLLDGRGAIVDTLGLFPGVELATADVAGVYTIAAPFGRTLSVAIRGDQILVSTGNHLGFDVYSNGNHTQRVRANLPPRRVSSEELDALQHVMVREASALEGIMDRFPVPEVRAPVSRLLVDSEGYVWVSDYETPTYFSGVWYVFNPAGHFLGELQTRPEFRVLEVGESYALGVWRDDLGVESVRMYRLDRSQR